MYKRYRPGQLALKEVKYYKNNAGFVIPISAIRRLCLEIGYNLQRKYQLPITCIQAFAGGCRMVFGKSLQRYKSASCTCQEDNDQHKTYGTGKKSIWRLWAT